MSDAEAAPKPPYKKPVLLNAPRIREIYFCDFPQDAILPEFWKKRPVLIISRNAKLQGSMRQLYGNVMILPISSLEQPNNPAAYEIQADILPKRSWIICDYVAAVSVARLSPYRGANRRAVKLPAEEFDKAMEIMFRYLPDYPAALQK